MSKLSDFVGGGGLDLSSNGERVDFSESGSYIVPDNGYLIIDAIGGGGGGSVEGGVITSPPADGGATIIKVAGQSITLSTSQATKSAGWKGTFPIYLANRNPYREGRSGLHHVGTPSSSYVYYGRSTKGGGGLNTKKPAYGPPTELGYPQHWGSSVGNSGLGSRSTVGSVVPVNKGNMVVVTIGKGGAGAKEEVPFVSGRPGGDGFASIMFIEG